MPKFEVVPIVNLKTGLFIKGSIVGQGREVELKDKASGRLYKKFIHELLIVDCSDEVTFTEKKPDGVYGPAEVEPGTKVSIWATKTLHEKLEMFPEGTLVKISEEGTEDAGGEFKRRKFVVKMEAK